MGLENIHEFDVQGMHFIILWKKSGCLLRAVEGYQTPQSKQYTAADLYQSLYDGTPNYQLTQERAIEQAPLVAEKLLDEMHKQEALQLEKIFASTQMQERYPIYKISELKHENETLPLIWAAHNSSVYIKSGTWGYVGSAKTQDEASEIALSHLTQINSDSKDSQTSNGTSSRQQKLSAMLNKRNLFILLGGVVLLSILSQYIL